MPAFILTRGLGSGDSRGFVTRGFASGTAPVIVAPPGNPIAALLFAMRRRRNRTIPPVGLTVFLSTGVVSGVDSTRSTAVASGAHTGVTAGSGEWDGYGWDGAEWDGVGASSGTAMAIAGVDAQRSTGVGR